MYVWIVIEKHCSNTDDCSNIDVASLLIPDDTTAVIIVIVCLDITDARIYYTSTQLYQSL